MDEPLFAPLSDGGRLAYTRLGDGPPLLLLRPLGGSMLSWGRFADALAERVNVIAFDARGTGCSSPAPFWTTTRSMARDAVSLLEHLGIRSAHVYGISIGGMVASWFAIDAPRRVDRLILVSTLPRGTELRVGSLSWGLSMARCFLRPPRDAEACMATRILSREFRDGHPADVKRIEELARARPASLRGIITLLAAAARHDVCARLHEITAQTLVLTGEFDPLLTLASQKELLGHLPRASYDCLAGVGHDVSAEAPEATAARILSFIEVCAE